MSVGFHSILHFVMPLHVGEETWSPMYFSAVEAIAQTSTLCRNYCHANYTRPPVSQRHMHVQDKNIQYMVLYFNANNCL